MREVETTTHGRVKMGPGTLYGTIKRLLKSGLIEETDERPDPELDDERRRYYQLTRDGGQLLRAEANRLAELVELARGRKLLGRAAARGG
jgi:DNA-binding PadR family transcriptional regulator